MHPRQTSAFEIVTIDRSVKRPIPWWLWPNLVSLDAPLIALLWQEAFAQAFHADLTWPTRLILLSTVWMIYAADRILDARRGLLATARHAFHHKYSRVFAILWTGVLTATAAVACVFLDEALFFDGVILLVLVSVYFALIHWRANWTSSMNKWMDAKKEWAVALVFSAGVSLGPMAASVSKGPGFFGVLLFALLCWINCEGIERWGGARHSLSDVCIVAGIGSSLLAIEAPALGMMLLLSAVALYTVDRMHRKLSPEAVRVLADAALLSPLLLLPLYALFPF